MSRATTSAPPMTRIHSRTARPTLRWLVVCLGRRSSATLVVPDVLDLEVVRDGAGVAGARLL